MWLARRAGNHTASRAMALNAAGTVTKTMGSQGFTLNRNLPMKLVMADQSFDGKKIVFYFTSEGRVDFRELVRDLAQRFHTRIEMRQIGPRDESGVKGGYGPCGRNLCCSSFLKEFAPISIRMAKDQNLSLNPSKISGMCGRLMCCLRYEHTSKDTLPHHESASP